MRKSDLANRPAASRAGITSEVPDMNGTLSRLQAIQRGEVEPPIARLIGFKLVSVAEGQAVLELFTGPQHYNPMGTLHGGVLCDLADAAMGMAYASSLGENESFTTLELKINFLRPFWSGLLVATGRLVKGGRTVGMMECDVTDAESRLVARASSTCMTLRGDQAAGRRLE